MKRSCLEKTQRTMKMSFPQVVSGNLKHYKQLKRVNICWLIIGILLLNTIYLYSYWEEEVMPGNISENFVPLAIGDGRNDGKNRIYGTEFQMRNSSETVILEYTWNGLYWEKEILFSTFTRYGLTFPPNNLSFVSTSADLVVPTIIIDDCQNDNKNHIYIGYSKPSDKNYDLNYYYKDVFNHSSYYPNSLLLEIVILEFLWSGSSWTITQLDTNNINANGQSLANEDEFKKPVILYSGDGRNDGKTRLYVGSGGGEVWEYSYNSSSWTKNQITTSMTNLPYEIDGLIITDGRNDNVNRIYVQSGGYSPYNININEKKAPKYSGYSGVKPYKLSEFSWNNGLNRWEETVIYSSTEVYFYYGGLCIGDARNDGIKRIYTNRHINDVRNARIIEYIFEKDSMQWKRREMPYEIVLRWITPEGYSLGYGPDAPNHFIVMIADAKNDGIKRIYLDFNGGWKKRFAKVRRPLYERGDKGGSESVGTVVEVTLYQGRMAELTWDGNKWIFEEISSKFMSTFIAGKARNDGVSRVYSAPGIELTYNKTFSAKATIEYLVPVNNYFNPLKGEFTTVVYKPIQDGNATIKIYTLNGRLVNTLYDGYQYKGEYSVRWNGYDNLGDIVSSGIYLVCLETPGISQTKKICVVK